MFYPAHLNLQNRKCLAVGGGIVAERKVISLLRSGADVTLISPETTKTLEELAQRGRIRWHKRQFQTGDTGGLFLVCAATDIPEINTQVFREAHDEHGILLVNVVDVIPECTFAAASIVTHGDFTISVSTSGKSPAMAKRIREYLEVKFRTASLYEDSIEADVTATTENQRLPYPVYFLLENRRCVVMGGWENMSEALAQRVNLLRRCGASVELNCLSDAFLVCVNDMESACENALFASQPRTDLTHFLDQVQLIECLKTPEAGTFTTPLLVMDRDLIIGISGKTQQEEGWKKARRVQAELASQFEDKGYGAFIDFLGALRPLVMEAIPTQQDRQRFFDDLIDQIPRLEGNGSANQKCCLGFENPECSMECTFNVIRHGHIDGVRQYALQRIRKS